MQVRRKNLKLSISVKTWILLQVSSNQQQWDWTVSYMRLQSRIYMLLGQTPSDKYDN